MKQRFHSTTKNGFTLIELMVSLTLFIVVVLALVTSLYNINNASRKVQAMRSVIDNLNFAIESMSRTIRTGSNIVCGGSMSGQLAGSNCNIQNNFRQPASQIRVDSRVGAERTVEYRLSNNAIERCVKPKTETCSTLTRSTDWTPITAPEIVVKKLSFLVDGAEIGDLRQPSVILFIEGEAVAGTNNSLPFSVQTYLSQRVVEQ